MCISCAGLHIPYTWKCSECIHLCGRSRIHKQINFVNWQCINAYASHRIVWQRIVWHHITWHRITSHRVESHHLVTSHRIEWHHITWHRIASCDIASCGVWHHITWHCIASCGIASHRAASHHLTLQVATLQPWYVTYKFHWQVRSLYKNIFASVGLTFHL